MSWLVVLLVLGASQIAFKRWQANVSYRVSLTLPIVANTFEIAADEAVPADTREILGERTAPLVALGFERLGFLRAPGALSGVTQTRTVLRHPTEHAFAVIGFGLLGHDLGIAVDLVTLLEDGSWVSTGNTGGHYRVVDLPQARYVEALVPTFAELWKAHRDAAANTGTAAFVAVDLPAVARHLNFVEDESMRVLVARGEALPTDDPARFRRTPASARQRPARLAAGIKSASDTANSGGEFGAPRIPLEEQERMYNEGSLGVQLRREASRPRLAFVVSAGAFAASMLALGGRPWLAFLMPAILFHELGHWSVMRLFGHDDAAITFIPFFGAATTSHKPFSARWREIVMLLAGPVPGIILGFVLVIAPVFHRWPRASEAGLLLIGLNGLNLLPLNPLDGGRVLHVLATAGRPRFDLVLKALASIAFLAGGVESHEPVLGVLGVLGLMILRPGYRSSTLETRIRKAPGFDVRLPQRQKRPFIFAALAEPPVRRFRIWLETVAKLELQLRHGRTPLWQALFWTSAFGAFLGSFTFLIADATTSLKRLTCPSSGQAVAVSCTSAPAFSQIDWKATPIGAKADSPPESVTGAEHRVAAFVWCAMRDGARTEELASRLREAAAGVAFCAALPWEEQPGDPREQGRRQARATLARLTWFLGRSQNRLERLDQLIDMLKDRPGFDRETAALYRKMMDLSQRPAEEARRALADRLGRSSTESCKRLAITNVEVLDPQDETSPNQPGPSAQGSASTVRFGAMMASASDFGDLGGYLCAVGCQVHILPWSPTDGRLSLCF